MIVVKHGRQHPDYKIPTSAECPNCKCVFEGIQDKDIKTVEGVSNKFINCPECGVMIDL